MVHLSFLSLLYFFSLCAFQSPSCYVNGETGPPVISEKELEVR